MKKTNEFNSQAVMSSSRSMTGQETYRMTEYNFPKPESTLEDLITDLLAKTRNLPCKERKAEIRKQLNEIIKNFSREMANEKLSEADIPADRTSSDIDEYLTSKAGTFTNPISFIKTKGCSPDLKKSLEDKIHEGNRAGEILKMAEITTVPADVLLDLVKKVCIGKCASWEYIQYNLGLAISAAKEFSKKNNVSGNCRSDLIQDAGLAFFEASQKYNADKGCSLSSFGTLFLNGRMPRIAKKYITSWHVSEELLKKTFDQHCKEKNNPAEYSTGIKTEYEILTDSPSLDEENIERDEQSRYETTPDIRIGDPAVIIANRSFNQWLLGTAYKTLSREFPGDWVNMYKEIKINGKKEKEYAEEFSVTPRTIRNRTKKMSERILMELTAQQEGFIEIAGYAHQPRSAEKFVSENTESANAEAIYTKPIRINVPVRKKAQPNSAPYETLPLAA